MTERNLSGKAVIVTGAGQGLGRAYAIALGREGASVVVNDVLAESAESTRAAIADIGGTAVAVPGSVADWEFTAALVDGCRTEYGRLDGLVNNAAIIHEELPWDESEQSLRRIVEVNVLGAMFIGVHALRTMIGQGSGSIVNIGSGSYLGLQGLTSYGTTKGAIASMTYGWALEARKHGVRVNALLPRATTNMDNVRKDPAMAQRSALGLNGVTATRRLPPEVIAPLVTYLLSDRAGGLTGQVLRHDGELISIVDPPSWSVGYPTTPGASFDDIAAGMESLYTANREARSNA